jgi:hypothetical protein
MIAFELINGIYGADTGLHTLRLVAGCSLHFAQRIKRRHRGAGAQRPLRRSSNAPESLLYARQSEAVGS